MKILHQKIIRLFYFNIAFIFTVILSLNIVALIFNQSGLYLSIVFFIGYNLSLDQERFNSKKEIYLTNLISILVILVIMLFNHNHVNIWQTSLAGVLWLFGVNVFIILQNYLMRKFHNSHKKESL